MKHVLILFSLAVALMVGWGLLFSLFENVGMFTGLYWSVTTATTVGYGDVTPRAESGHVLAIFAMLTEIPALASCFGLLTSWHIRKHMRRHVDARMDEHRVANDLTLAGIRNVLLLLHGEAGTDE